jgi:hypothetical protein
LKGILSEHSEQAPIFIKNSFQTTALIWILSLWKKPNSPSLGKTALRAMEKAMRMISKSRGGADIHKVSPYYG